MRFTIVAAIIFALFQTLDCQRDTPINRLGFFDIELLQRLVENKKGNVMISPASIKSTLGMLLEGAQGETSEEIKEALRVSPVRDDFRYELKAFLKTFEANSTGISLQNANALFISKNLKLKKDYEAVVQRIYFSEIQKVNFNDAKASADTVNNWVSKKTHGLIPTIVEEDQITPSTVMMVTNALYFKAPWKYSFNTRMTHKDCFYNKDVCTNVSMMVLQDELNYAYIDDLRAHAIELPYQDDRYSMILLVTKDRDVGYATIIRDLPYIGISQIPRLMEPSDVVLQMPKFDVEYSDDMTEPLRKLGIKTLFSPAANLSRIFELGGSAYVSSIQHSVHMKVDEEGTVAAAASTSAVVPLINDQVRVRLDRPFLFFIRDKKLGVILFQGKIDEPTVYVEPSSPKGPQGVVQAAKQSFASQHQTPGKPQVVQHAPKQPEADIAQHQAPGQANFNRAAPNNPTVNEDYGQAFSSQFSDKPTVNQAYPIHTNYDQAVPSSSSFNQKDVAQQAVPVNKQVNSHVHKVQNQPNSNSYPPVVHQTEAIEKEPPYRRSDYLGLLRDYVCPRCY